MREMLRDLLAHKKSADLALLAAVEEHTATAADPEVRALLEHVLLANRFWMSTILGEPFAADEVSRPADSLADLRSRYTALHARESAWASIATDADFERHLEHPLIPGSRCTVAQALLQVCLHSHGHRAQCAKLIRRDGGVPPRTDFILWLADRQ